MPVIYESMGAAEPPILQQQLPHFRVINPVLFRYLPELNAEGNLRRKHRIFHILRQLCGRAVGKPETVAGIINAIGVTMFLYPVRLYDSGISGLSMLLDQVTSPTFTLSIFLIALNAPIFLLGLKKQGISFTLYSLYAIITMLYYI